MPLRRPLQALTIAVTSVTLVAFSAVSAEASTRPRTAAETRALEAPRRAHVLAVRRARAAEAGRRAHVLAVRRARALAEARRAAAAAQSAALSAPLRSVDTPAPTVISSPEPASPPVVAGFSGEAAPRGDLPGWHQTFVEDFGADVATGAFGGSTDPHWYTYKDGTKDTSGNGTYMPSKVLSVHDGALDYSVRTENGQHLVAAPVLRDTYGQTYGRYSVRYRADEMAGYKIAWLLWPDSEKWPIDGEFDFPEGELNNTISAHSHYATPAGGAASLETSVRTAGAWHTATIEWLPGKATFILDGKVLGSSTQDVASTAMHWVLQTETEVKGTPPADGVSGHVLVDWISLYTRA